MDKDSHKDMSLHQELPTHHSDPLIAFYHRIIRLCIKILAALMVLVIIWGIGDVIYVLYQRLIAPPFMLLNINDIFYTFGAFMAVLIAVEIFINIRLYLEANVFPVRLVVATALMAVARKVIVLDVDKLDATYIFAIAATVLALGVTYWLMGHHHNGR